MLELDNPSPGLLFFGLLYRSDLFLEEVLLKRVESLYGKVLIHTPTFNPLAAYYAKEMGEENSLKRIFFVTTTPFPREFLLTTKLLSLDWEREWAINAKRMVNVDVGFISAENFILATTKNYAHRIFLGQNIFADLTYQCSEGGFQTLPWT
ncbi:MAG: DUF4416 family protein, partial [Bdellovibrionales bacterium]|nr:DUF4416 family protein [Bdellovibrionales bacterium]